MPATRNQVALQANILRSERWQGHCRRKWKAHAPQTAVNERSSMTSAQTTPTQGSDQLRTSNRTVAFTTSSYLPWCCTSDLSNISVRSTSFTVYLRHILFRMSAHLSMFVRTSQHRFTNAAHVLFVSLRVSTQTRTTRVKSTEDRASWLAEWTPAATVAPSNRRGRETRSSPRETSDLQWKR